MSDLRNLIFFIIYDKIILCGKNEMKKLGVFKNYADLMLLAHYATKKFIHENLNTKI